VGSNKARAPLAFVASLMTSVPSSVPSHTAIQSSHSRNDETFTTI
jgi:hypothetical protein